MPATAGSALFCTSCVRFVIKKLTKASILRKFALSYFVLHEANLMGAVMQDVAVAEMSGCATRAQAEAAQPQMHQMPLSFLKSGEEAAIASCARGKGEVHHHLENLGFVEGAKVKVVTEQAGNLIVEVKGSQVALNKQVASRIITC